MSDSITIPKLPNSSFPEYLNAGQLRALGIEHIQKLGSDLWTDHNVHDPGITILEVLCYALTDLGYRTNFDVKDLLAPKDPGNSEPNFFTAESILTCNPVTINDLRKLLIDIPGIKNAWFERAPEGEIDFYLGAETRESSSQKDPVFQYTVPELGGETQKIRLRGLYDVCIEFDDLYLLDACGLPDDDRGAILDQVRQTLQAHRNLCEDIRSIVPFGEETIGICAKIELAPNAVPEDVLLGIFLKVEEFLSPSLRFYTLQELLKKGKAIEEIFEGRPVKENSHGFIDTEELKKMDPQKVIYSSDIVQEIMDVDGVIGVQNLFLVNYIDGYPQTKGEKWCLPLTPKYRPHIDLEKTANSLSMFKGVLPFRPNFAEVSRRYREEKIAGNKSYLDKQYLDKAEPRGIYRELDDYYSIQNDFPLTYGIGEEGIPGKITAEKRAQVNQLKAYLLFYDQILANYLMQLSKVRDLFSTAVKPGDFIPGQGTYFAKSLSEASISKIDELILNFNNCSDNDQDSPPPDDYWQYLNYIIEDEQTYYDRRNRFLDHLLARFGESFTDYVLLSFKLGEGKREPADIIQDKADFLHNYPAISHDRGKAFDYTDPIVWDTDNLSGLEKRVSKLIGIDNIKRHSLCKAQIEGNETGFHFFINLPEDPESDDPADAEDENEDIKDLRSKKIYATEEEAGEDCEKLIEQLGDPNAYRRFSSEPLEVSENAYCRYNYIVLDKQGECIAESRKYNTAEDRDDAIQRFISHTIYPEVIECEVVQSEECYFYQLLDYTGDELLLEQIKGYDSKEAAFGHRFDELTKDPANYLRFETDGAFSFKLKDLEGDPVAGHPADYDTANERDDRLQAIIFYMASPVIDPPFLLGETGAYKFEIRDVGDHVVFEGIHEYETERQAYMAAEKALYLARFHTYYHLFDELEGEFPYGFELRDRKNEPFAIHPNQYKTECERDLVIDTIVFNLNDSSEAYRIVDIEGLLYYELTDITGKAVNPVLMRSANGYEDEESAREGIQEFMDHATEKDNYESFQNEEEKFTFHLKNGEDEVIALHPAAYDWEKEQKMALKAVLNLVNNDEFTKAIAGQQGNLSFRLEIDENREEVGSPPQKRVLLEGANTYPDKYAANQAFEQMLRLATEIDNYHDITTEDPDPAYGFELKDEEQILFAVHPETYPSPEERDAAKLLLINYVRKDPPQYNIENKTGAFYVEIMGRDKTTMLIGTEILPTLEDAQAREMDLLHLAKMAKNFKRTAPQEGEETDGCKFGFELTDGNGNTVARHPGRYATEAERDEVLFDFFTYITEGAALADQVVCPVYDDEQLFFTFDKGGEPFLRGSHLYATKESLMDAFREILALAIDENNYLLTGMQDEPGHYQVFIRNAPDGHLAELVRIFETESEAKEARDEAIAFFQSFQIPHDILEDGENYRLVFVDPNTSKVVFVGKGPFASESEAEAAAQTIISLATVEENYRPWFDEEDCNHGFDLVDTEHQVIAIHPHSYATEEERDQAIAVAIQYFNSHLPEPDIHPTLTGYTYKIVDFAGNTLIKIVNNAEEKEAVVFSDEEAAKEHYLNIFLPVATTEENYALYYDNANCRYAFVLEHPDKPDIWTHEGYFANRTDRDKVIQLILQLLGTQEGVCYQAVREAADLPVQGWTYTMKDSVGRILLKVFADSHQSDPLILDSKQAAQLHFAKVLQPYGSSFSNYTLRNDPANNSYSFVLKHPRDASVWTHPGSFSSQVERDEAIWAIIALLNEGVECEKNGRIRGQGCGFNFSLEVTLENPIEDQDRILFHSSEYFPDATAARKCCNETVLYLKSVLPATSNPEDILTVHIVNEQYQLQILDENGALKMTQAMPFFVEESSALAFRDFLIQQFSLELEPSISCTVDPYPIPPDGEEFTGYFSCTIQNGNSFLIKGVKEPGFNVADQEEKNKVKETLCSDCNELLERIQEDRYICLLNDDENCWYTFEIYGKHGNRIAYNQRYYPTAEERDDQIKALQAYVNDEGMHLVEHILLRPMEYDETPDQYYYFEYGADQEVLLTTPRIEDDEAGSCSFSLEFTEEEARDYILKLHDILYNEAFELNVLEITEGDLATYELQVIDDEGQVLAVYPERLIKETPSDDVVDRKKEVIESNIRQAFGSSYQLGNDTATAHFFEILNTDSEVLLRSPARYNTSREARNALTDFIGDMTTNEFRYKIRDYGGGASDIKELIIVDPENESFILAIYEEKKKEEKLEEDIKNILNPIFNIFDEESFREKIVLYGSDSCAFTDDTLRSCIDPGSVTIEGDDFLPPADCHERFENLLPELADSYSFRATIVLPYWPERFRQIEFRNFLEQTLRREAPAHVFLRICWVGVCQMCEFEEAYRNWLLAKALGDDSCPIREAKSELISILTRLRNIYPEGSLSDCGVTAQSITNPIILNQTVLGTG